MRGEHHVGQLYPATVIVCTSIYLHISPRPRRGNRIPPENSGLGCSIRLTRVAGGGFKKMIKKLKCDRDHLRGPIPLYARR